VRRTVVLLVIPVFFVALVTTAGGASSTVLPKVTLTVVVNGDGSVASRPLGIACPSSCKLHVKQGTRVMLVATPGAGSVLSRWGTSCGRSLRCVITMVRSRVVTVSFKAAAPSAQPQPQPPPQPPAPPATPGHYSGTYSDGTFINFDVASTGTSAFNFDFDLNGHCSNGGTSAGELSASGPFSIQSDGSFTGTVSFTQSDGTPISISISGRFGSNGSASGTLNVAATFGAGITCTSNGTWTARINS
jgi:Divergent InlB B-repeat domain